jgi:hypothetical protein
MPDRAPFTITRLRLTPEGWPEAYVSISDGPTLHVDRRYGSWQADVRACPGSRRIVRRDVLPHVAHALQRRARSIERRAAA